MKRNYLLYAAFLSMMMATYGICATTLTTTYLSYNPADGKFDLTQDILYQLPDPASFGPGPYPVAMWTPGTFELYSDPLGQLFIGEMSNRGFIGATVQYSNTNSVQNCTNYTLRAQGVYDSTRTTSAAKVMCALPLAACSTGIVTAGISQGAGMAILSKNYNSSVKAVFGMSIADTLTQGRVTVNLASCLDNSATTIGANRLTIVNGAGDTTFNGQNPVMNVSGISCPAGTTQCWSSDGSGAGWYLVQNSQVNDGLADHCYELVGGCISTAFDTNWFYPASYNWSFDPNLDWLASLGTHRNFSTSGQ